MQIIDTFNFDISKENKNALKFYLEYYLSQKIEKFDVIEKINNFILLKNCKFFSSYNIISDSLIDHFDSKILSLCREEIDYDINFIYHDNCDFKEKIKQDYILINSGKTTEIKDIVNVKAVAKTSVGKKMIKICINPLFTAAENKFVFVEDYWVLNKIHNDIVSFIEFNTIKPEDIESEVMDFINHEIFGRFMYTNAGSGRSYFELRDIFDSLVRTYTDLVFRSG